MNYSELVKATAESSGKSQKDAKAVLDAAFGAVLFALASGGDVTLADFGKLKTVNREQRQARNPRTGEPITIAAHRTIKFKPSKSVADAVA